MKKMWMFLLAAALFLASGCAGRTAGSGSAGASGSPPPGSSQEPAQEMTLSALLGDITNAAPGSAGCSLKQARAAGELLDWAQSGAAAGETELAALLDEQTGMDAAEIACAYAEVLDFADRILAGEEGVAGELDDAGYTLQHDGYDETRFRTAAQSLSPLFTRLLDSADTAGYSAASMSPTDYAEITLERLSGVWCDSRMQEMLIVSGETCRVVIPSLEEYGDTAYSARIRDRSSRGFCPALEIDLSGDGSFEGPLAYYISGMDETGFWCGTQSQYFEKLA